MTTDLLYELRLVLHARLARAAIMLLLILSALAVWSGLQAASSQRAAYIVFSIKRSIESHTAWLKMAPSIPVATRRLSPRENCAKWHL